ncbi:MAG: RimK family alpha-L-glutamate ligase [Candidatus Aenigmatarchaeota archaeon]
MKLAILGPSPAKSGHTTNRILDEARRVFKKVEHIPLIDVKLELGGGRLDAVYKKDSLGKFDYVLPRIDSKRAVIGYPVISFLDSIGVKKPYPAETVLIAHNKFLTLHKLLAAGIPVPKTWLTGSKAAAKELLDKQKMPIMLKLLSGFGGMGVMFMDSKEAAQSAIETIKTLKQEICLEEFLPNPGEDIRGIVAGEEIIASYKRVATPEEKRANIHAGGKGVPFKLTPEMEETALKAAKAVGAEICAIDMIQSGKKLYVIEVNINPGLQGIEKATNINVAQRMVDFIKSELKG